jgi:hypothetical protein
MHTKVMNSEFLQPHMTAEAVLEDNLLHPVVSSLSRLEDRTIFWISEAAESPDEPVDHEAAECHRVDLEIDSWIVDEDGLRMSGKINTEILEVPYHIIPINRKLYMGRYKAIVDYYESKRQD